MVFVLRLSQTITLSTARSSPRRCKLSVDWNAKPVAFVGQERALRNELRRLQVPDFAFVFLEQLVVVVVAVAVAADVDLRRETARVAPFH